MDVVAVQLGVFLYAILAAFVASSMRLNRKQNRPSSTMMVMTGWGLFSFSAVSSGLLFALAAAMALKLVPDDGLLLLG
ncbi:hypothetical protein [Sphingomonas sp. 3-13AW]|uniref:hypothetical protein n=1 Tax=Sphingomonas sp. 3-13AW TaxID=3050450 RepID=UPI003BB49A4C